MSNIEINYRLKVEEHFDIFHDCIQQTVSIFTKTFGTEVMSKIDLYIDNGIQKCGHVPGINVVFNKYLLIKLKIPDFSDKEKIVYQFAHELCHYVFYALYGFDNSINLKEEENICSAMSLIAIKMLYPDELNSWVEYVDKIENEMYNNGGNVARECNFDINKLKDKIYNFKVSD